MYKKFAVATIDVLRTRLGFTSWWFSVEDDIQEDIIFEITSTYEALIESESEHDTTTNDHVPRAVAYAAIVLLAFVIGLVLGAVLF
jgi:hypothetical protein